MKISRCIRAAFVLFLMISGINAAGAAPVSVTVQKTEGSVMTRESAGADWVQVAPGDMLSTGVAVRTGAGSSCILKWGSGNVAKVQPLTNLAISKLEDDGAGTENTSLDLSAGKLNVNVQKLKTAGSSFTVTTPTAVAGVRGTALFVNVAEDKTSTFGVTEGAIYVEAGGGETIVSQDFIVTVTPEGMAATPEPMTAEMKQEATEQIKEAKQAAQVEIIKGKDEAKQGTGAQGKGQGADRGKGIDKQDDDKKGTGNQGKGEGAETGIGIGKQEERADGESGTPETPQETTTDETVDMPGDTTEIGTDVAVDTDVVIDDVIEDTLDQNTVNEIITTIEQQTYDTGQFDMDIYINP